MVTLRIMKDVKMNKSKELVVWESPNGIKLPGNFQVSVKDLSDKNNQLSVSEINKIVKSFTNEDFDMAAEYIWVRTINRLRKRILSFGVEFVQEMLGVTNNSYILNLPAIEVINLAADLGFINGTGKMKLTQINEVIDHFTSEDTDEEMDSIEAQRTIKACFQYILCYSDEESGLPFIEFRDDLKSCLILESSSYIELLKSSPYFYVRTIIRTLLNLMKITKGVEQEFVFSNMRVIIPCVWNILLSDDKWPIGTAYAEAVNNGIKPQVQLLKEILLSVKGFDYVPENLRSATYIDIGKRIIGTHFSANNFYNEESVIKQLYNMGSIIPMPALGTCLTALLLCRLGNRYGRSYDAQSYITIILGKISKKMWTYYFDKVFPGEEAILYKLAAGSENVCENLNKLVDKYNLNELEVNHPLVYNLINSAFHKKRSDIMENAHKLIATMRGNI